MGAVAPVTPWIPKDDILLKNAVEGGASLESLAKGAVQFSRRFTIRELRDRWHALLYDPIISAEASARMVEYERSQSSHSSKSNKADNSKETNCGLGKRNTESIKRGYYAMRKRICNKPLNHGDINFLVAPGDDCFVSGADGHGPDGMMNDQMTGHYGLENTNLDDLHQVFPAVPPNGVGEFPTGQQNNVEDSIQQSILHTEISQIVGNTMVMSQNCPTSAEAGSSKQVPGHDMFEANGLQAESVCGSKDVMCSGFGGDTVFNSTISDCETSFRHLQYASSPPTMPDWKNIEGTSVPEMPVDGGLGGDDLRAGDPFGISGNINAANRTSEYVHPEPEMHDHMSCTDLKNAAGCGEGYFDDLFNFTSEDEMLIIDGVKDGIDKTYLDGLSSLLLNSPDEVNEDALHDAHALEEPTVVDANHSISPAVGPQEKDHASNIIAEHLGDNILPGNAVSQIPMFTGTMDHQYPELHDGVICCVLNTEDPDIPCNDDILVLSKQRLPSVLRRTQSEANNLSASGKDYAGSRTGSMKKWFGECQPASQSGVLGSNCTVDECGVKFEATGGQTPDGSTNTRAGQAGLCQSRLVVKNEPSEFSVAGYVSENSGQVADLSHAQIGSGKFNTKGLTTSAFQNQEVYASGPTDDMALEPGGEPLFLDPDEQLSESDADVPYFSDIESMILDMDLGPDDQDSCMEVAKYQHEDIKRELIRLEQNAQSYMRRALVSHGAFAILYGRHSKHYIKKAEVLIGRGTEDISVDIDLGREGRANKISRRQAIIKMEKDGTFHLRNLGKCSIYMNSKEIHPGQTLSLLSNCLVEIRGMPFIFETNQACMKKYLDAAALRSEAKNLAV